MVLKAVILLVVPILVCFKPCTCQRTYYMDRYSDCGGRDVRVDDNGIRIMARSPTAPSNPPLTCTIYLGSMYSRNDGTNKLEISVETLKIHDCSIKLDLFNGRTTVGVYLKALSCNRKPENVILSKTNEVTLHLSRPQQLMNTEYGFSLFIKPFKDKSVLGSEENTDKLSVGAIIGIAIGGLVIVVVLILVCRFCCADRFADIGRSKKGNGGQGVNYNLSGETIKAPAVDLNASNSNVWSTQSGTQYNSRPPPRYFQRGMPRNNMENGRIGYGQNRYYGNGNDRQKDYEYERRQGEGRDRYDNRINERPVDAEPVHNYEPYNAQTEGRSNTNRKSSPIQHHHPPPQPRKETLIDDVFDSEDDVTETNSDYDDATLQKRRFESDLKSKNSPSPKSKRKSQPIPEEENLEKSPQLERYKSMDLQSQPDTDTITSPVHINAGVRASVVDTESPINSLRRNKLATKSPKSRRKGDPDSMAMPPEAFEPIFTEPITGINYPNNQYQQPMMPQQFMPYGMIPSTMFAPGVPGSQTFAYAYQTVPQAGGMLGQPATQGAYIVHNTPTTDGNKRTAFAVEQTVSPDRTPYSGFNNGRNNRRGDPFDRSPYRDSGSSSKRGGKSRNDGFNPDLSVVTRGAAPPDPGQGHRSVALKSGTDPNTGIHTVQGVWTDTVADPTDPGPGVDNPKITRKTITRVTTKSGYEELPPDSDPLLPLDDEPAFLNPSGTLNQGHTPALMPSAPPNIGYYTGTGTATGALPPPERSSTPTSTILKAPKSYNNGVIRDRIPFDDSTV